MNYCREANPLAGPCVGTDIASSIRLQPAEKLTEVLTYPQEGTSPTTHDDILLVAGHAGSQGMVMLITLSGLDGSGKTTLIRELSARLTQEGHRVVTLTMYDNVGLHPFLRFLRSLVTRMVAGGLRPGRQAYGAEFKGRAGQGQFEVPTVLTGGILRMIRSRWVKRCVLPLDLLVLLWFRLYLEKVRRSVLILDRYFYDSLVDVADEKPWTYTRALLRIIPRPDVPIFVSVSPEKAFARKGEYTLEEMHERNAIYHRISGWVPDPLILPNDDLQVAVAIMEKAVAKTMRQP